MADDEKHNPARGTPGDPEPLAMEWNGQQWTAPPAEHEDDDMEVRPRRGATSLPAEVPQARSSAPPPPAPRPKAYVPPPARVTAPGDALPAGPARNTGNACVWIAGLAALIVLACALLGLGALQTGLDRLTGWVPRFPGLPLITPTVIIQAQGPSVVEQIQALSRLETSRYAIEKVLTGEATGVLPILTHDKILFVAHGDVVAGVDLGKLTEDDVRVVSGTVTIRLPPAEILSASLDNSKSYVYNRDTGLLGRPDPNLESQIRQEAEKQIRQAALEDGILARADENARTTLRTLLHGLKYETVIFETQPPPLPTPVVRPTAPVTTPIVP